MRRSIRVMGITLLAIAIACSLIWYAASSEDHRGELEVVFLQNGPIFIRSPSGRTILVNGGSDDSILRELGGVLPFYRRSIDIVIAAAQTPADVGGLASVIARYDTSMIVRSAARSGAPAAAAFTGAVSSAQQKGSRLAVLERGEVVDLGGGASIEVFFPDRDASQMSPNDGCLLFKLLFGDTSFFFACGSPAIEQYVATLDGAALRSDVLAGTGDEPELFLGFVSPQFAALPCGASATSSTYAKLDIETATPCSNPVVFVSDGQTVTRE